MTKKQIATNNLKKIGNIIMNYRLTIEEGSREKFIQSREELNMLPGGWISLKTLSNIENGYNMPSLTTLKILSTALEVDFVDLISEIEPFILGDR